MCVSGNIMVASVDYNFITRTLQIVSHQGYECEAVYDNDSAFIKLINGKYNLVIIDMSMPGGKDLELAYKIRNDFEYLPIIIVTDTYNQDIAIELIELNIVAFINKYYKENQLIRIIDNALNSRKQHLMLKENIQVLNEWSSDLNKLLKFNFNRINVSMTDKNYSAITMNNMIKCLNSINNMMNITQSDESKPNIGAENDRTRLNILTKTLIEAVKVIDSTKSSFKSKELGNLKKKILDVLAETVGWESKSKNTTKY